ncbi:FHA domain-containing protein [Paenibacillus thalictri]|uniref:FHA domain-containing protein n=1 Tax=Paenibacillus thalictri TaxID=2527873 RepID=A0A4Q9DY41_9BACL|nr:FHA domain-containing protein [Paenibacillus thalictri]TBL81315.1 FHA domain-containing protein [Paenibacillus thalictri]
METFACLYIIRGEPYRPGTCVNLSAEETVAGRSSKHSSPDISFSNAFISRKHFMIRKEQGRAVLYDMGSRHGTEVNGNRLPENTPYRLQSSDIIKLAKGMIVIHFSYIFEDQTLEFEPMLNTERLHAIEEPIVIHWEKRECIVEGKKITMSEKEYSLMKVLFDNANQLVPVEDIKRNVWPERSAGPDGAPDVSIDELNALVYRIRKKYGKHSFIISAVRGSGYILEKD